MFNCSAIPVLLNRALARIETFLTLRDELSVFLFLSDCLLSYPPYSDTHFHHPTCFYFVVIGWR